MKTISLVGTLVIAILLVSCSTTISEKPNNIISDNTTVIETPSNANSDNISISSDNISANTPQEKMDVYLLVQDNCTYCTKASDYLKELEKKYPIKLVELNTCGNDHIRCMELCQEYGVSPNGVPVLFFGKYWLVGWGKVAEEWVRNWADEYNVDMIVNTTINGNDTVDISMIGSSPKILNKEK